MSSDDGAALMVGEHVWLDGELPGRIAYLGETGFGTGDWAGVVLDDPLGKHSGTVGGRQYFQCEAGHGVFCRISRLHASPAEGFCREHGASSQAPRAPPRRHSGSPTRGASRTASPRKPSTSQSRATRPNSVAKKDFNSNVKESDRRTPPAASWGGPGESSAAGGPTWAMSLGDRVQVRCSDVTVIGTLRFLGLTQFAGGLWAGVQLDSTRGKSDGCVAGTRYFECSPNCGLFAPANRVFPAKDAKLAALGVPNTEFRLDQCY